MRIYEKNFAVEDNSRYNFIQVSVNYFPKRYTMSVQPVKIKEDKWGVSIAYPIFIGKYFTLTNVSRRSKKQDKIATDKAISLTDGLLQAICKECSLTLKEGVVA